MNTFGLAIIMSLLGIVAMTVVVILVSELRRIYFLGIAVWSRWIPILAVMTYDCLLVAQVFSGGSNASETSLARLFSSAELLFLLLLTPMLFTRLGNITGIFATFYIAQKFLQVSPSEIPASGIILLGSSTIISVLADRLPWINLRGPSYTAITLRELMIVSLSVITIVAAIMCMAKVEYFCRWLSIGFGVSIQKPAMILLLLGVCIGWISVAVGVTRVMSLPILSIPSLLLILFVTNWPSYILVLPFALSLSLTLAIADRRQSFVTR